MQTLWVGVAAASEAPLGLFPNNELGFAALTAGVEALKLGGADASIHLVVEPTLGYELALVAFAYAQGWQVSLPNPKQVRDWAKGTG